MYDVPFGTNTYIAIGVVYPIRYIRTVTIKKTSRFNKFSKKPTKLTAPLQNRDCLLLPVHTSRCWPLRVAFTLQIMPRPDFTIPVVFSCIKKKSCQKNELHNREEARCPKCRNRRTNSGSFLTTKQLQWPAWPKLVKAKATAEKTAGASVPATAWLLLHVKLMKLNCLFF